MKKRIKRMYDLISKRRAGNASAEERWELESLVFFFGEPEEYKEMIDEEG